jgi:ABC-type Fe3+ transport system permease subunit
MRGAIVFLAVFIIVLLATLPYPSLPPGAQIYNALNVPTTDYQVLGVPATTLIIAVFNGAIYGIIAWLIYTIADRARKSKPQKQQQSQ